MRARDEEAEEKQGASQSSAHASPAMRIYEDAIGSILSMLQWKDLIPILAVSREWSAAVRSMPPINASRSCGPLSEEDEDGRPLIEIMAASPLLRHLAELKVFGACHSWHDSQFLAPLAEYAPNLTSLRCSILPKDLVVLPAKLSSLHLRLGGEYTDEEINDVLTAVAALPSLSRFGFQSSAFDPYERDSESAVDFSLLGACSTLSDLALETTNDDPFGIGEPFPLTDTQVEQIRSSLGHLHRFDVGPMSSADLARFLRPPTSVRWQHIGEVIGTEDTGELLLRLPTLTTLKFSSDEDTRVDFLPKLPHLTLLDLECEMDAASARALFVSLRLCTGLAELRLTQPNRACGFNSAQRKAQVAGMFCGGTHHAVARSPQPARPQNSAVRAVVSVCASAAAESAARQMLLPALDRCHDCQP